MTLRVPLRASTSQNARFLNPFARAAVVKRERRAVRQVWEAERAGEQLGELAGRLLVKMVRVGPNELDDDNLAGSLKAVRDEVAAQLGVDDRDRRVRFLPEQRSEGHLVARDARTGRKRKLGIFAVEVLIFRQVCGDCHVDHCACLHADECCEDCRGCPDA